MKAKFFLCCLLAALIFTSAQAIAVRADTIEPLKLTYARADAEDIYLCSEMDENAALFAIPYTYCVQVLETYGDWYKVRYAENDGLYTAVEGFCLSAHLTVTDKLPEKLYLNMPVKVTLKADSMNGSIPVLSEEITAAFYGVRYFDGYPYSYLYYKDKFNYVFGEKEYDLNEIPTDEPAAEASGGKSNAKLITAIALTGLAAVALVILYLTGRKTKYIHPDK